MINTNVKKQYPVIRMPNGHPVSSTMYNRGDLHGVVYSNDIEFDDVLLSNVITTSTVIANLNVSTTVSSNILSSGLLLGSVTVGKLLNSAISTSSNITADTKLTYNLLSSLITSSSVVGNITIPKLVNTSLVSTGTIVADLTVTAPSASLLLDLYPSAAAAYSLRKLRSAYTGSAIRVRRSSDNTEQDIGFTGNDLDTTALTTFVGSGNGFVTTWYDQSGNARNVTQTTQASQPQIVSSGVVISTNSKPSVRFNGTSNVLNGGDILSVDSNPFFISQVAKQATTGNMAWYSKAFANTQAGAHTVYNENNIINARVTLNTGNNRILNLGASLTTPLLISSEFIPNTSFKGYVNNIEKASNTTVSIVGTCNLNFRLGGYGDATNTNTILFFNGEIQEFIFYLSNQTTNRSNINSNINTHYGIY